MVWGGHKKNEKSKNDLSSHWVPLTVENCNQILKEFGNKNLDSYILKRVQKNRLTFQVRYNN